MQSWFRGHIAWCSFSVYFLICILNWLVVIFRAGFTWFAFIAICFVGISWILQNCKLMWLATDHGSNKIWAFFSSILPKVTIRSCSERWKRKGSVLSCRISNSSRWLWTELVCVVVLKVVCKFESLCIFKFPFASWQFSARCSRLRLRKQRLFIKQSTCSSSLSFLTSTVSSFIKREPFGFSSNLFQVICGCH